MDYHFCKYYDFSPYGFNICNEPDKLDGLCHCENNCIYFEHV